MRRTDPSEAERAAASAPAPPSAEHAGQLLVLCAAMFVAMVGFGVVIPALGDLALSFGASSTEMGVMTAAYALAQLVSAPAWGALSDRLGRKPVLVLGLFGFAASFLVMARAETFGELLAGRALGGLLSSSALATAQAFAADLAGPQRRAVVMGRLGAATALGFVVGPLLSVWLHPFGARAPFVFSLVLSLGTGLAAYGLLRDPPRSTMQAPGPTGSVLRALGQAAVSSAGAWFWTAFVIMFGASSVFALLVYFIEEQLGGTALHASLAFACFGATSVLTQGVLLGPLSRRLGERRTVRLGLVVGVLGFLSFGQATDLLQVYLATALVAAAMSLGRPCLASLLLAETSVGHGLSLGLQSAFDSLGRVLGPICAGLLYQLSPRIPFMGAAAVYLVGLACLSLGPRGGSETGGGAGA